MDSPLLPTIRGGPRDLDESFADMSLASARSPDPPSSASLRAGPAASSGPGPASYQWTATAPGRASIFGRPPPTRIIDDTPEPPRYVSNMTTASASNRSHIGTTSSTGVSASANANGYGNPMDARQKPRQSIFPPVPLASSLRGSSTRSQSRPLANSESTSGSSRPTLHDDYKEGEENLDGQEHGDGDGDVTILPSTSASGNDEDEPSAETRGQVKEGDGITAEARMKRDERLKDSLYELRGMNDTFEIFLNALESARGHNQRLALRVKETSTLLDQYTALLGQTEHTQKLLSNPNWTGANDDLRALEAEQAAREAAENEALRVAEEAARKEEEEQERKLAAQEAARAKEATRCGTRGGRGGVPPVSSRGGITRGRGSGIPAPSTRSVSGGRPPTTSRTAPSGLGLAGQYANVKSSGYGPSRKAT